MCAESSTPSGLDLTAGLPIADIPDGSLVAGRVDGESVLLARRGAELFAVGATCTHYSGPLPEGLLVGDTIRCPWHHACFSLRTGRALRPPALNDVSRWRVERRGDRVHVTEKIRDESRPPAVPARGPMAIVGAGAAGAVAAETLRRDGYEGEILLLDPDGGAPCDRPNLSKDYLAGTAPEDWIPLRPPSFYAKQRIELIRRWVTAIDPGRRRITLEGGEERGYEALLLAPGATPVRLDIPIAAGAKVHYLRTLADSRAIIAAAERSKRIVVLGASFIGLEVAASLRHRKLEVHVVAPERRPLEQVMGPELGDFIRALHEEHGVVFHLGHTAREIGADSVTLDDGTRLPGDFVVAGIGVRPNVELAETAGLTLDRGIGVDEYLETSAPGIFAAGDVARWPDPHTGERIRVEHWVVAERQGQAAARNMLGRRERYDAVPFFWSQHYDVQISYVGHAERWDEAVLDGDPSARDCAVTFRRDGKRLAVATIFRDRQSLETEVEMEREVAGAV